MSLNKNQVAFVKSAERLYGIGAVLTRDNIQHVAREEDMSFPFWFVTKSEYRSGRGQYQLPDIGTKPVVKQDEPELEMALSAQVLAFKQPKLIDDSDVSIPTKHPDYVPFGFFKDLNNIIKSQQFYPVFITGLSGNGKTLWLSKCVLSLSGSVSVSMCLSKRTKVIYLAVLLLSMVMWLIVMVLLLLQ